MKYAPGDAMSRSMWSGALDLCEFHELDSHPVQSRMHIIYHDFEDLRDIPKGVQAVLQVLPALKSTAGASCHKLYSKTQFEPAAESHAVTRDASDAQHDEISGAICRLSNSFAALTSIRDQLGPRSTVHLWHMFFNVVSRAAYEEAVIL